MYKSYIIIGSKGLLGKQLVKLLKKKNAKVISVHKKNYNKKKNSSADVLINANGNSNKFFANSYPFKDFRQSFLSVYKTLLDFKFKKYIYISSGDVYQFQGDASTDEKKNIKSPKNFYGKNKHLAEIFIQYYCSNWLIFRMGPMIGVGLKKNAVFNIKNNKFVFENIETQSSFINSFNVAKIVNTINKKFTNEIFNLSGKGVVSLKYIKKKFNSSSLFDNNKKKKIYHLKINKILKYAVVPKTINEIKKFSKV